MSRGYELRVIEVDLRESELWRKGFVMGVRNAVRGLWAGHLDYYQAWEVMDVAITNGFTRAWYDGADDCGVAPSELSPQERTAMQTAILEQRMYIDGFLTAIEGNSKANGKKLGPHLQRARLWSKRYDDVKNEAKAMACADKKLRWDRHAQDSCRTCISLEGKVKRGSYWKGHVMPNSDKLECVQSANGIPVCRCVLVPTDQPCSPGPLPMGL